jgi:hypothetical protein
MTTSVARSAVRSVSGSPLPGLMGTKVSIGLLPAVPRSAYDSRRQRLTPEAHLEFAPRLSASRTCSYGSWGDEGDQ